MIGPTGAVKVMVATKPVDVRPAEAGEVVVTIIKGEGKETESPPAKPGDMVVRNRGPETGNEPARILLDSLGRRAVPSAPEPSLSVRGDEELFQTSGLSHPGNVNRQGIDELVRDDERRDAVRIQGNGIENLYPIHVGERGLTRVSPHRGTTIYKHVANTSIGIRNFVPKRVEHCASEASLPRSEFGDVKRGRPLSSFPVLADPRCDTGSEQGAELR